MEPTVTRRLSTAALITIRVANHVAFISKTGKNTLLRYRLRLHGIGYIQIRLESDPLWYGSTVFTQVRFETGTVRFHMGSSSYVDPFGTR